MLKNNIFIFFMLTMVGLNPNRGWAAGEAVAVVAKDTAVSGVTGAAQNAGTQAAVEQAAPGLTEKIGNFFNTPAGVLIVSGIGTVYSGMLYSAAAEQEEESKANMVKIDKIIAAYKDSWSAYCPKGRESLNEPNCYCYLDSGAQNPNRSKSQTCVDLWAKNSYKLSAIAGDYKGAAQFVDPVGCLTISGQFDENCKCKKFVDAKGNNACAKTASISIPAGLGSGFVTNTGIKEVLGFAANTSNGNPRFDLLSNGQLGAKAIATTRTLEKMIAQFPSSGKNGGKAAYADQRNIAQLSKGIFGEKAIAAAIAHSSSPLATSNSGPSDPQASALLKSAAAKAGLDFSGSGRGLQNRKSDSKDGASFNFLGDSASAASGAQMQDFPETQKNYNYKNSDISKNSDTTIFEIISNRYMQSGLKRLFDN